jgi:H+-transporting ATPase
MMMSYVLYPITMIIAFDNASVPPKPVRWELDHVLVISSVLGLLGVIQSFGRSIWVTLFISSTIHNCRPDVPATRSRWPPHVVRYSHQRALWKRPYPNFKPFFVIVVTQIAAVFMCNQGWLELS